MVKSSKDFKEKLAEELTRQYKKGIMVGAKINCQIMKDLAKQGKTLDEILKICDAYVSGDMEKVLEKTSKKA